MSLIPDHAAIDLHGGQRISRNLVGCPLGGWGVGRGCLWSVRSRQHQETRGRQ